MRIINDINIDMAITVLRVLAAVLTGAALLCWARMAPRLLAAGLATVLAILVLAINSNLLIHLDTSAEWWVRPRRSSEALADWSEFWINVGDPIYFAAVVLTCGAWFSWQARSVIPAAVMVAGVGVAVVLEQTLKVAVARTAATVAAAHDRPRPPGFHAYLHSFPSGHVTVIGAFLGTAAVCLCAGRHTITKIGVSALAGAAVVFIGIVAVYTRSHTLTDVVGGAVLSAAIVAMASPVLSAASLRGRRMAARRVAGPIRTTAPRVRVPAA